MKLLETSSANQKSLPRLSRRVAAVLIRSATIESWKYAVNTRTPEFVPSPASDAATMVSCNRLESDFCPHSVRDPFFCVMSSTALSEERQKRSG